MLSVQAALCVSPLPECAGKSPPGDPPRVANQKINFMTRELYDKAAALKSAAFADVVGSVASRAIIDQGTNASGSFIKFADGMLITWGIRIISYGAGGDLRAGRGWRL